MSVRISVIPLATDNYGYLLESDATGQVAVVDPTEAAPVAALLAERKQRLDFIFNTHHHPDHCAGNRALKDRFGAQVVGFRGDAARIPGFDLGVDEGSGFTFGGSEVRVLEVPGHTLGAIAFYLPEARAVFTGDTLFLLGCGRLFEGTAEQMFRSLGKLKALPGDTRVYCGHEYTVANAEFGLAVYPGDEALRARHGAAQKKRARGQPTVPATIAEELAGNPFLRAPTAAAFADLRRRKDHA